MRHTHTTVTDCVWFHVEQLCSVCCIKYYFTHIYANGNRLLTTTDVRNFAKFVAKFVLSLFYTPSPF